MSAAAPFEKRADRAEFLARGNAAAGESLRFAAALFRVQGRMAESLAARHHDVPLSGRLESEAGRFADLSEKLLSFAESDGPPELSEAAATRRADDSKTARSRLLLYWAGERETAGDYLSRAMLRPYVETLLGFDVTPERPHRDGHCPYCGGRPIVSFRRSDPESHGAARFLVCGLCGTEWRVLPIQCPSCGEADPAKLPAFGSEQQKGVRIEACETCRRYVKSMDLTIDARPIPEVDDLVSIAMDLWAMGEGFERVEPGWAGI